MIDDFLQMLSSSPQHKCFYHFTDARNLPLIRANGGLLSAQALKKRRVSVPAPGGNEWSFDADRLSGMDAYVHLCFTRGHPMRHVAQKDGRIVEVVWLEIEAAILKRPGVLVTTDVANKSGVTPIAAAAGLSKLDLNVLYMRTDWKDPAIKARLDAAEKGEVLVPTIVPIEYIRNANG